MNSMTTIRSAWRVARPLGPTQRRALSSSCYRRSHATASEVASRMVDEFAGSVTVRQQLVDGNQLQKLALTLGRNHLGGIDISHRAPLAGTPIPPAYHLVYFTPNGTETELGPDGSDRTFNAVDPFTRRMWAGGKMTWKVPVQDDDASAAIRVGDEVEERTILRSATAKKSRSAGEMVLVEVEKEIWGPRGLALVDQRSWVFRPEINPETANAQPQPIVSKARGPTVIEDITGTDGGYPSRQLCWSPAGLFRFSALTFNGHKIHYNEDWARMVEGHPGVVVHGPLNLINLLDYWRDVHGKGRTPSNVTYRAMAPVYAGETYQIRTREIRDGEGGAVYEIVVEKAGIVCMKSEISCSG